MAEVVAGLDQLSLRRGGVQAAGIQDAENGPRLASGLASRLALRFACGSALLVPAVHELALVGDAHELLQVFAGSGGCHAQNNVAKAAEASAFLACGGDSSHDVGAALLGVQVDRADNGVEQNQIGARGREWGRVVPVDDDRDEDQARMAGRDDPAALLGLDRVPAGHDQDRTRALVRLPGGGDVNRPALVLLVGRTALRLDHDGDQSLPRDRVGDDDHAVGGVLLRLRFSLKAAVRPRSDVGHVLRPEDGGHLWREREGPHVEQQLHPEHRVLANQLNESLVLN